MRFSAPATAGLLMVLTATVAYAEPREGMKHLDQLKEGNSTRQDAIKLLGKPMMEHKMTDCAMCTWSDGDKMVTCVFDKKGVLQDVKEWKPRPQWQ